MCRFSGLLSVFFLTLIGISAQTVRTVTTTVTQDVATAPDQLRVRFQFFDLNRSLDDAIAHRNNSSVPVGKDNLAEMTYQTTSSGVVYPGYSFELDMSASSYGAFLTTLGKLNTTTTAASAQSSIVRASPLPEERRSAILVELVKAARLKAQTLATLAGGDTTTVGGVQQAEETSTTVGLKTTIALRVSFALQTP